MKKNEIAEIIKGFGFQVFVRPDCSTYAFYTDGKHFGYVQDDTTADIRSRQSTSPTGPRALVIASASRAC